jgi:hypothetical protein
LGIQAPRDINWSFTSSLLSSRLRTNPSNRTLNLSPLSSTFLNIYDWDTLSIPSGATFELTAQLELCTGVLPCALFIKGASLGTIFRSGQGQIRCDRNKGCVFLGLESLEVICDSSIAENSLVKVNGAATLQILNSTFTRCSTIGSGAVTEMSNGAEMSIHKSKFDSCFSVESGGAISVSDCTVSVSDSIFSNCSSWSSGGAVSAVSDSMISFMKTFFKTCSAKLDGGSVVISGGSMAYFKESTVVASTSGGSGGAISSESSNLSLSMAVFANCTSSSGGGSIRSFGRKSLLKISRMDFTNCSSASDGGALQIYDGVAVSVISSTFFHLTSGGKGGALSIVGSDLFLQNCTFSGCSSLYGGGAIFSGDYQCYGAPTSAENLLSINSSVFKNCWSTALGGALMVSSETVKAVVFNSVFSTCSANGGGAIFSHNAHLSINSCAFTRNIASAGGGGALLWEGFVWPNISGSTWHRAILPACPEHSETSWPIASKELLETCCLGNIAVFGPCLATTYSSLFVSGLPQKESPVLPGIQFTIRVLKMDRYNQTIASDSDSVLQTFSSKQRQFQTDASSVVSGTFISRLNRGIAELSIVVRPTVTRINASIGLVQLDSSPALYFEGIDAEVDFSLIRMQSIIFEVFMENSSSICPNGFILFMDQDRVGSCSFCSSGTYSINPLVGHNLRPMCYPCPVDATCNGGTNVSFLLGDWEIVDGVYRLIGCPPGYQLINKDASGRYSHDAQRCHRCLATHYILDSMNADFRCETCPTGKSVFKSSLYNRYYILIIPHFVLIHIFHST